MLVLGAAFEGDPLGGSPGDASAARVRLARIQDERRARLVINWARFITHSEGGGPFRVCVCADCVPPDKTTGERVLRPSFVLPVGPSDGRLAGRPAGPEHMTSLLSWIKMIGRARARRSQPCPQLATRLSDAIERLSVAQGDELFVKRAQRAPHAASHANAPGRPAAFVASGPGEAPARNWAHNWAQRRRQRGRVTLAGPIVRQKGDAAQSGARLGTHLIDFTRKSLVARLNDPWKCHSMRGPLRDGAQFRGVSRQPAGRASD